MSYEALKAERDALAVENAALRRFCKDSAFDADYESELGMERGGFTDALNNIETPSTSAVLAAIEARGVEKYAELFKETVNMERKHNQEFYNGTLWFAKQMREAK